MNHKTWPKAICLDLDNTLHDYSRAARIACERTSEYIETRFGISKFIVASRYEQVRLTVSAGTFKSGIACRAQRFRLLLDTWPETKNVDVRQVVDEFGRQLLGAVAPNPGGLETIKTWQDEGRSVLIVTEGFVDIQSALITSLGLTFLRTEPLITSALGVRKQDGSAYRLALKMLAQDPTDVVMIGDNWDWDIVAAARCGIWQVWLTLASQPRTSLPDRFIAIVSTIKEAKLAIERSRVIESLG